jgi:hypothetical protein
MKDNLDRIMERKGELTGNPSTFTINKSRLRTAIIILGVLALGFLMINQAVGYFYKAQFLKSPCGLCGELNPEVKTCIENLNNPRASYWTSNGWSNPFNNSVPNITFISP